MKFSTEYDHHTDPGINDWGPSLTRQEFLEESDVNLIIERTQVDGLAPLSANAGEPIYGDFTAPELRDFHAAQNIILGTGQLMDRLPARVRERFGNDVANVLAFIGDANNRAEAIELGLIDPPPAPPAPPPTTLSSGTPAPAVAPPVAPAPQVTK